MSVRDKVDYDYLDKLTDEDREKLALMTDAVIGAEPKALAALNVPEARKREIYREKNAANRDLYANVKGRKRLYSLSVETYDGVATGDESPTPAYLEAPEYKAALREYRDAIDAKDAGRRAAAEERMRAIRLGV